MPGDEEHGGISQPHRTQDKDEEAENRGAGNEANGRVRSGVPEQDSAESPPRQDGETSAEQDC